MSVAYFNKIWGPAIGEAAGGLSGRSGIEIAGGAGAALAGFSRRATNQVKKRAKKS